MEKPYDTDLKHLLLWRHQFGSYCFAFTIIFAWTSLSIIILGLIGNFVTILIRCAKNQKTKNKAPIFYAIRSLAVSDFIFLVLSMISWIFILTKVNNTVLYFTTGIIVTFSLVDFTFNVYPRKCSINSHLRRLRSTTVNPVNTRRMSGFICCIVLFNGVLQFSLIFILIWKNYLTLTVSVLVSLIHSCNPYMFILFHFLCD